MMRVRSFRVSAVVAVSAVLLLTTWRAGAQTKPLEQPVDKDHAEKMARGTEVFKQHVRPILEKTCLRCHGGKTTESEFDMHDRASLLKGGLAGPAIVPGKARDSLLYKLVTHQKEPNMPEGSKKLSDEQLKHIETWIDLGAPFDRPLLEKDDVAAWTKKRVPETAREFWSFQPLKRVEPPMVKNTGRVKNSIDRFLLAKLEAAGVEPNPEVEKRVLLRRLYLGLTGLPPSPEEVDEFVRDAKPQAVERVVEKLLSSPRYGERWGRYWLDLARFGESHGFEHDYDRPSAYHYRDFVIQALNDDMPYHQFVRWQLAGDELAPNDWMALKATGFLAAGVHSTQITQREVEKHRYDELDDIVATTGTAMLGLTVGCARCHDHKFDPIPQADYYRMVSAFTTTVRSEVEMPVDEDAYREVKAVYDSRHAPLLAAQEKFEKEQLPGRFAEWEKANAGKPLPFAWTLPEITSVKSAGGATLTRQADGSYLASGTNPPNDTFTFTVKTGVEGITGVRLEAMSHPSFVKGGPGRAANGNFALTDFKATIAPKDGSKPAVAVKFKSARATFEQAGLPVKAAIDDNGNTAWAVDPQFGKDHAAVFEVEQPVGFAGGSVLTFTLLFKNNTQHAIGRPRLSFTTAKEAASLTEKPVPENALTALGLSSEKRTAEQRAAVLRWYATLDPEWNKLNAAVVEHSRKEPKPKKSKVLISTEGLPAVRLHTQGEDFLKATHYLRRGDPEQKQGEAPLGYLQVLVSAKSGDARWQPKAAPQSRLSFRRTALADWMTDTEQGAGHLLARVIVNRLWQYHMGRGIVPTSSDYGLRGEKPTHPELLDWLATELIKNGWRLKPIHKLIVTSAAYAQSSKSDPAKVAKDRDNRLVWRRPALRLEAESIRDSLLAVGGALDPTMYGPGTLDEGSRRRSIYFTVKRSKLMPMLQVFDAPEALVSIGERPTTTIAPQALFLMNSPHVRTYAQGFARRVAPDERTPIGEAVTKAYRIALTREPDGDELMEGQAFIKAQEESYRAGGKGEARHLAVADFCQTLMCLNEFIYVD